MPNALLAALVAGLLTAAPAAATTWTVDAASGGCAQAGTTCKSLTEVAGKVQDGDTVEVRPGLYVEPGAEFTAADLTITGAGFAQSIVRTATDRATLTFSGENTRVSGLGVRQDATGTIQPAIRASGRIALTEVQALSSRGTAVELSGGTATAPNQVIRSGVVSFTPDGIGLDVVSPAASAADKALTIDSSILAGGAQGVALRVRSLGGTAPAFSSAGDVAVNATRVTASGGRAVLADASAANGNPGVAPLVPAAPAGSIAVSVRESLLTGPSEARRNAGSSSAAANTATIAITDSDSPVPAPADGITLTNVTQTPPAQLFVNAAGRDYRLRADAPVIDRGPARPAEGESATDVEGQDRAADGGDADAQAQIDWGADEFHNRLPVARLAVATASARQGVPVVFDARGSVDPDVGGGLAALRFYFGDGTSLESTTSAKVAHAFAEPGVYTVTVRAIDRQGGVSAPSAPVTVTVADARAPTITITSPRAGTAAKLTRPRRKGARRAPVPKPLVLAGRAADPSGVARVQVALKLVRRAGARRKLRSGRCEWFAGRRKLAVRPCKAPPLLTAKLIDGRLWSYTIRGAKRLPKGSYELRVIGTDRLQNAATGALARFRVR